MTSHHRKRFFSNDNTTISTGTLSGSNSANTSPNHQVRIRVVDRNLSASSSQSSQRSQSPPDQLIADLSKSESDLRLLHQLHFSPVDQSMDSSYNNNNTRTATATTTTSPTHSGNFAGMDHSWTAGQAATSSNGGNGMNGSGGNNNRRRASHNNLQRHHSGESLSLMRGYTSPRSRPELQRNRSPPIHSYSAGTVVGPSQSTRHRGSPRLTPKRNASGEFHHHHNHHDSVVHGQQSSPSGGPSVPNNNGPSTPYGMLNPGSSYQLHGRKGNNLHHHHHSRYHFQHYYHHSSNYTHNLLCSVWNAWINFFYSNGSNNSNPHNPNNNANKHMIALFGFCTLFILGMAVYQHDAMLQDALLLKGQEVEHHVRHAKELEKRVQALRQQNLQLQAQHQQEMSSVSPDQEEMDLETQRKLFHWEHANLRMQHDIQQQSRRLLREKYGHGPKYYVQMKLEFDTHSNVYQEHADANNGPPLLSGDDDTIILETASIDDMPHSVYLFLEQVDHRLYDHTTFHRNAPHLVMAGPSNSPHAHALFRHSPSLNSVIFQEYAPEMSHKQYTLGYSGRPGGPDFYVNMRDNSAIHGPGGQHHAYSDLTRDADPCFAKIVRGFETMERVHRSNVMDEGINNLMNTNNDAMVHPVIIEYMKVLPHDYVLPHSNTSSEEDEDEEDEDEDHHHHHHHGHHDGHHGLRHQQQQRDNELETIM